METTSGMLKVEIIKLVRDSSLVLEDQQASQKGRQHIAVVHGQLVSQFLEHTQVRVVGTLDKAVEEDGHLIHLLDVASHDVDKLLNTVLKEEQFNLLRVSVEEAVGNHFEGLNHEGHQVVGELSLGTVSRAFAGDGRVHVLEALAEETDQVWEIQHAAG